MKKFISGRAFKTFAFSVLLMTMVLVVTLGILYVFLPQYYFTHMTNRLDRQSTALIQTINQNPSADILPYIFEFSVANNAVVMSHDVLGQPLFEFSSFPNTFIHRTNMATTHMDNHTFFQDDNIIIFDATEAIEVNAVSFTPFVATHIPAYITLTSNLSDVFIFDSEYNRSVAIWRDVEHPIVDHMIFTTTLQPIDQAQDVIVAMIPYLVIVGFVIALIMSFIFSRQVIKPIIKLERSKTDLMRAAGHELKTPITALSGMIDGMIDKVGVYKNHEKYLPELKMQVERLARLVHEILTASQTEKTDVEISEIDIDKLINETIEQYHHFIEQKEIKLSVSSTSGLSCNTDRRLLLIILSNLLSNAIKYAPDGGSVRIGVVTYKRGKVLYVENQCPPIDPDLMQKWFEPFYTPDYSRDKSKGGTGLGLYIVKKNLDTLGFPFEMAYIDGEVRFEITLV
ncbi:MAG: HAMP domain-containing histidine kinase [Defluviitaleaceae bacterium]|nr:HAMP domain-containing histidine kinase [Defluviitaleaceae bacterium]